LLSCAAAADGYSDFNAGVSAEVRDEPTALQYLSSAISATDLPAHLKPLAYLLRGRVYANQNKFDESIRDFTTAIDLKPDYALAYVDRCRVYWAKKDYPQAIADCGSAKKLQPDNWRLGDLLARIYLETKQYPDAIANISTFIARRPAADGLLLLNRAEYYRKDGQFEKALADANAAHQAEPTWFSPESELGFIYFSQKDFQNAVASFAAMSDLSKKDATALLLKGEAQLAMGQYSDATESFEDALGQVPLAGFGMLWLTIAKAKESEQPLPRYLEPFKKVNYPNWPGPLVALYLGKSSPEDVLKLHGTTEDAGEEVQCGTDFFIGEWYAMHGNAADGKRLLQEVATSCASDDNIRILAGVELGRMP